MNDSLHGEFGIGSESDIAMARKVVRNAATGSGFGIIDVTRIVTAASELPSASIVTLDRVVCCYPSCQQLLDAAVARTERCVALSYPRDVWYVRAAMALENGQRWLARNSFRTFVHPVGLIEDIITRAGFRLSSRRESWMWSADVYVLSLIHI